MNLFNALGLVLGTGYSSGLNLYASILTLGLLQKFNIIHLPQTLQILSHPAILSIAAILYLIEFFADKIPYLDSIWDSIHTFIRPPAAALLAYASTATIAPEWRYGAALLAGSVALASHGAKASTRLAANTSPEPFSNWFLSFGEDVLAVTLTWLASAHPIVTTIVVTTLLLLSAFLIFHLYRFAKRAFQRPSPA
jgi:hypothetical protein